jgi:photosystem II stability/assembly factor-like uncharacterized protein
MSGEETMQRNGIRLSRLYRFLVPGFVGLGIAACGIASPGTAAPSPGAPTHLLATRIHQTKTGSPTFTLTSFPSLTGTATPTGTATLTSTPYPKDTWISLGPEGGEVTDIVIDPLTPSTLYAVTSSAGIFKSTDNGKEWKSLTGEWTTSYIRELLIDPFSPTTLYLLLAQGRIYRSTNGGDSWKEIYPGYASNPAKPKMYHLAIDPSRPNTLYAHNEKQQILRSTNGGVSWIVVGNIREIAGDYASSAGFLEVIPINSTTLFLGTYDGLLRSVDGGVTWSNSNMYRWATFLVADPESPDTLYLGSDGSLFLSSDGGAEWKMLQNADFNVQDLAVDPQNPSILYAVTGDKGLQELNIEPDMAIRVSTDKGKNWADLFRTEEISINRILMDPTTSGILYAGTNLGIIQTEDGGKHWEEKNKGLNAEQFDQMVIDPTAPCRFYRMTRKLFKSEDCGANWTTIDAKMPDKPPLWGDILLDYEHPSTLYLATRDKIYKSLDGGENWKGPKISTLADIIYVGMDPHDPECLYMITMGGTGHYSTLRKSMDGGERWERINDPGSHVWSLTLVPTIPTTIYALSENGLLKSEDGGYQWSAIDAGVPASEIELGRLIADPIRPNILYLVSKRNRIFISQDGGGSWREIHTNLPELYWLEIIIDPVNTSTMYAFTYWDGIFQSRDGGRNWKPFNTGLRSMNITFITFDPQDHLILYAGTGSGLYTMHLSG